MDNYRKKELLQKLKDGTLTREDERELWSFDNDEGGIEPFDDGEPDLDLYSDLEGPSGMEESLARISAYQAQRVSHKKQLNTVYRIAASMAAVFLLYFGFTKFSNQLFVEDLPAYVTIEVNKGMVRSVALPDGSVATVSPGSVLRYPEEFAKDERKVYLDRGEAFFEVAKNPEKPFRVEAGELQTTALGTSFTVQYDPLRQREKVNLYTGRVSVEAVKGETNISAVELTPGKAYEYIAGEVILSDFNNKNGNPIAKGLHFEDVPFEEAMYRISVWYGLNLTVDSKNNKMENIYGNFTNKKIEDIFFFLSGTHDIEFTKTDSLTYKIVHK